MRVHKACDVFIGREASEVGANDGMAELMTTTEASACLFLVTSPDYSQLTTR